MTQMPVTIRAGDNLETALIEFVNHYERDIKLICIEGYKQAGKTTLLDSLDADRFSRFELDVFLPPEVDSNISWIDHIRNSNAASAIEQSLDRDQIVAVEGVLAWDAIGPIRKLIDRDNILRVYIKRMRRVENRDDEFEWFVGRVVPQIQADTDRPRTVFNQSIFDYHFRERPWLKCDLLIERTPAMEN